MNARREERARLLDRARPGATVPFARRLDAPERDPAGLFRRLRASGREAFLLESVEGSESVARYTFLGSGPVSRLAIQGRTATVERGAPNAPCAEAPLEALANRVVRPGFLRDPELPPLCAGAVGYLGYDAVRLFEDIPESSPRESALPDGLFLLFDAVYAFDRREDRVLALTTCDFEEPGTHAAAADEALARLDRLESIAAAARSQPRAPATVLPNGSGFSARFPRERFLENVARAKEAIFDGDLYQVVLSQRWSAPLGVDPFDVYLELREINPSPYLFYLETREGVVFGASPEMLVRCRGREVETRPIAGTAPRGATAEEDARLAAALLADEKERAEHVMLVDLARNDLGRVCAVGSVRVTRSAQVERYSHVQHLVSEVHGTLAVDRTPLDALASCFPAGTLTGAPKIRAMERIGQWEGVRRGVYGGAVGYLDRSGDLDLAIAIRTAVVEQGVCHVQAGAGIVADSVPEREYREAESKAAALFRAVEAARERAGRAERLAAGGAPAVRPGAAR